MARIRTIKPDFWTDEKLSDCSIGARLLFIGTWNFADDNGNLPASAKKLKMQIFPADNVDCQSLLNELITQGVLSEYSVNGEKFLHIKGFKKHQVINRPSKSSIPEPNFKEDSMNTHGVLIDGKEGKGREIERKKHNEPFQSTLAGLLCKALKDKGVQNVNPAHPTLLALLEAGATLEEFENMAASTEIKTFAYVIGAVKKSREQAANLKLVTGDVHGPQKPWFITASGIEAKGKELGVFKGMEENFQYFKARVLQKAGISEDQVSKANIDFGERKVA